MAQSVRIGIIKEGKVPVDHRVPLTPIQCRKIMERYPNVEIVVQPSGVRRISDQEYLDQGIQLEQDMETCDVLMGVKEVPIQELIPNKTFFFFSHTIKKQPYNRKLLRAVLDKNITLVDYECLKDEKGERLVAFGRWAGIVGAYNGLLTYGKRFNTFQLKPAHACFDMNEMYDQLKGIHLDNIKIVITGGGRVAQGAMEVLNQAGIRQISKQDFLSGTFNEPVFTQLDSGDYNKRKDGTAFDLQHFYSHPEMYESAFVPYAKVSTLFLACAYWDPKAPVLFSKADMRDPSFHIKVIADITCDIDGSVPSTCRSTTIQDPHFDFDPHSETEQPAFTNHNHITVMAIDNLPCELPRDASEGFGEMLTKYIVPELAGAVPNEIISRASITKDGSLTDRYTYLSDYASGE